MSGTNERVTEEIVREILKQNKDYYEGCEQVTIKSEDGSFGLRPDFLLIKDNIKLVIECKKDITKHQEGIAQLENYITIIPNTTDVYGIAISGNSDNLIIDSFYRKKDNNEIEELKIKKLLSIKDYKNFINKQKSSYLIEKELKIKARELHEYMRNYGALRSGQKAVIVSAILLALNVESFKNSYVTYDKENTLANNILSVIKNRLIAENGVSADKRESVFNAYSFIKTEVTLNTRININNELQTPLKFFTEFIDTKLLHGLNETNMDLLGMFYTEFFSYTTKDGNELGIVLTPNHVTGIMTDIIKVTKDDVFLDTCAGTGGFLVTAMHKMLKQAKTKTEILKIKRDGIIGVELDSLMYAMSFANMVFRGDGKSNLILGSCFDTNIVDQYKNRATTGGINPSYSMAKKKGQEKLHELNFVLTALNGLLPHGRFSAIIPVNCFIGKDKLTISYKKQLLEKHTLEAVISMPDQLFYPTGTVTAIGVFTAHVPHPNTKKTWFYSLKDDGFEITRKGRLDVNDRWVDIKNKLLEAFENRTTVEGKSAYICIKADDEWVAEAYIEADYSTLTENTFIKNLKELYAYEYLQA